jgi:hypothetical protein
MTCPKCSGALAMLFTSTYCPKCEAKEPAQSVAYDHPRLPEHRLYVGEDGELWWRHNDISWRITTGSTIGPIAHYEVSPKNGHAILTRYDQTGNPWAEAVDIRHLPGQPMQLVKAGKAPGEYSIAVPVSATGISSSFEISLQAMPMYGPQEWVEVAPPGTCIKRTNPPGVGEDE